MIDPTRHRQLQELNIVELCTRVLTNARSELYLNMRYLDVSLSSLGFEYDPGCRSLGTDGYVIYYNPDYLAAIYRQSRIKVNRAYLHMVLHCLFTHMDTRGRREEALWNLSCDVAVESVIDGLYLRCVHEPPSMFRRDWYLRFQKRLKVLNAEGVYRALREMSLDPRMLERLAADFCIDDHQYWTLPEDSPKTGIARQNQWKDNREKMQTEMETLGTQQEEDARSLLEQVRVENRERYDYRGFLRKFRVLREEMQVDADSFDPIFYTFGLSLYGNMPLIEPLESKEVSRIEDFVIAIDTSMSCSGDLVRRFLEETYDILCENDSYFKKTNIHIIQCDEQIRQDQLITSKEEMERYMEDFTIIGQGGTDFRPVFEYVNQMIGRGEFSKLKGLLYFTDGEGVYPVKRPVYETAFVFVRDQYTDISVPPWAIKLILEPEQITENAGAGDAVKIHDFLPEPDAWGHEIEHNEF
ncbi:MAG: VWA-like domain-containing protein [Clostridiales bacterium]|nr:VWA-like domain-containing protein [Clostridiales bacterium]